MMRMPGVLLLVLLFSCTNTTHKLRLVKNKQINFDNLKQIYSKGNDCLHIGNTWKEIFYIDGDCPKCLPIIMEFVTIKKRYNISGYCFVLILNTEDELSLSLRMDDLLSDITVYIDKNKAFLKDNDIENFGNGISFVVNDKDRIVKMSKKFISIKTRNQYFVKK